MRISLVAACLSLCLIGFSSAGDAHASIRRETNIPAEGLGPALNALAKDRNFQIVYVTEEIENVRTGGAVGEFTIEEALKQLLIGTGLAFSYLDDRTVTIGSAATPRERSGRKSSSEQFRLAQANQGEAHNSSTGGAPLTAQPDQPLPGKPQSPAALVTSNELGAIIVTAQRRAENQRDVPITMSALSGDELKEYGVTNTRDLSGAFPGLVFTTQGIDAEPTIRGVTTQVSTPAAGAPVAIYVDGLYQGSQAGNVFELPDVQQIEVLKGPQGTLYGRNATGGAILVSTLKPSFAPTGSISVSDGAFFGGSAKTGNNLQTQIFLSGPLIADTLAGSISAAYGNMPGYYTNDLTGGRWGRLDSAFVRAKLLYRPVDNLSILLSGSYSNRRDDVSQFPLLTAASEYPGAILPTQPWHTTSQLGGGGAYSNVQHKDVALTVDWTLPGAGTLTSHSGYTRIAQLANVDVGAAYSPGCLAAMFVCDTPYAFELPVTTFQQEFTFASEKFGRLSFIAGAIYLHETENGLYNLNPPITATPVGVYAPYGYFVFDESVKTRAYAAFFEGTFNITDALSVIAGARYSYETKTEYARGSLFTFEAPTGPYTTLPPEGPPIDKAVTPKLALRYTLNPSANLFLAYNRGFKSSILAAETFTAPAARPETIDSFEGGIKYADGPLAFNTSAFFYIHRDLQVETFTGSAFLVENAASAKSGGLDADGSYRVTDYLKLHAGVSWIPYAKYTSFPNGVDFALPLTPAGLNQITVDATGQRLLRDPKYTANISADYWHGVTVGRLDARLSVYRSAAYSWDLLQRVHTDAYTTLNGQVSFAPTGSHFKYTLYGNNLTNKVYITGYVGSAVSDQVIFAPPREVGLRANYSF